MTRRFAASAAVLLGAVILASTLWHRTFFDEPPPKVAEREAAGERPPLEDCTSGVLDPRQPPRWSVTEEALVYQAVITHELLSMRPTYLFSEVYPHPSMVIVDPDSVRLWLPPGQTDLWPMNRLCRENGVRHDTAVSFRAMNRFGTRVPWPFALPVAMSVAPRPERHDGRLPNGLVYVRLSRVGFSVDFEQALVMMEVRGGATDGGGDFFVLDRTRGAWRVTSKQWVWDE